MLKVERVADLDGLQALQEPWRHLLSRCAQRSVFMTPEWASAWWEHFGQGRQLWALVVRDGSEIVGLAPMMVSHERYGGLPVRTLGFLRNRHTSRADIVIPERRSEALRALAEYWRDRTRHWDVLRLVDVPRESGSLEILRSAMDAAGLRVFAPRPGRSLHRLRVQGTWEGYLRRLSASFRRSLHRARSRLAQTGELELVREDDPKRLEASMQRFWDLNDRSRKGAEPGVVLDPRERRFQLAIARRWVAPNGYENFFLLLDGQPIAGLHCLRYERTRCLVLTTYDQRHARLSPGLHLFERTFQEAWKTGYVQEIDFNGDALHVRHWTSDCSATQSLSACNVSVYSRLIGGMKQLKRLVRREKVAGGRI